MRNGEIQLVVSEKMRLFRKTLWIHLRYKRMISKKNLKKSKVCMNGILRMGSGSLRQSKVPCGVRSSKQGLHRFRSPPRSRSLQWFLRTQPSSLVEISMQEWQRVYQHSAMR